ncbi:hypothetical protein F4V57_02595 [Acinetobacter qingfengensis]|uniref:Uncharacterized protein n=1 Tax=Acinetobacter qingfengensis TaxID=1262585 RepID=A0A1E7R6R2_9GAMM|nr:hypothetical protein [Acinetobacter qingfengensis]KAA8734675.1 hypothetical protein F4V57_02595 [Acinetobacter qingfengensis]OEY94945.1 hypothetical protein BJI46_13135 [Acinetobacter qingfengensis]
MSDGFLKDKSKDEILDVIRQFIVESFSKPEPLPHMYMNCGYLMCLLDLGIINTEEFEVLSTAATGGKEI